MKKKDHLILSIIAVSFLWTGSSFFSVAYRLIEYYSAQVVDIYLTIIGYLLQALGMLIFALGVCRKPDIRVNKRYFTIVLIVEAAVIMAIMLIKSAPMAFALSFVMNLLHGMVAGFYLTLLGSFVQQQFRGRVFGFGYAIGSIGTWILSLIFGRNFLSSDSVVIAYTIMIGLTVILSSRIIDDYQMSYEACSADTVKPRLFINLFIMLVLLSLVKNLGFYFPASDVSGIVNVEFSRAFYAIGLTAAGIINDINRRYGAICCVASLSFAFFSFALYSNPGFSVVLWIVGYVFFGFFAVYRVVVFADTASKKTSLLPLAAFGLMAGRTGDSLGTLGGLLLTGKIIPLILITSVLFILVILLFFYIYNKLYSPVPMTESERRELKYEDFEKKYVFSRRESEVFRLVVQGLSNLEISGTLYVSESTVKYHVGNILKKTGSSNRSELTLMFKGQ